MNITLTAPIRTHLATRSNFVKVALFITDMLRNFCLGMICCFFFLALLLAINDCFRDHLRRMEERHR